MPARDRVKGRRRLAEALTIPTREFLAHDLLDEPFARNDFEGFGDGFADFGKLDAAAAGARGRRLKDDALARQMLRKRLARRLPARVGGDQCRRVLSGFLRGLNGGDFIFCRARFEIFEFKLHLLDQFGQTLAALGFLTESLVLCLRDSQSQKLDQRTRMRQLGFRRRQFRFALDKKAFQRRNVVRENLAHGLGLEHNLRDLHYVN